MKPYEVKSIIIDWLKNRASIQSFGNHEIETEVPIYAKKYYKFPDGDPVIHSPGTFSRAWRDLRTHTNLLSLNNLRIDEVHVAGTKEKYFRVSDARVHEQIDMFK